jgi:DNA-binding beta-propeller fold protein YncE
VARLEKLAVSTQSRRGAEPDLRVLFRPACIVALLVAITLTTSTAAQQVRRFLYVAVPGAGNESEYRGVGILVFDIDKGHSFVKRIPTWPAAAGEQPEQVRGIAASAGARRLFVSTVKRLAAFDLVTDKIVWEKSYDGNCCDRIALSPDGSTVYAPAFGAPRWHVIDAASGAALASIDVMGWPRQAMFSPDGAYAYLSAWESPVLSVVDVKARKVVREIGPFTNYLCPFTINGRASQVFANVDGLVGFEVGDLQTGLILDRVVVEGYQMDAAEKYECPSHGIALTPDEGELWVADGVDNRLHIFDAATYPPVASTTVEVRAQPRWITFGIDGRYAYPSSGDVIERASKKVTATLEDERGMFVHSERMLEIQFTGRDPIKAGEQIGAGQKIGKSEM